MLQEMFWGGIWFGWIFWIIILVLVIWLIVNSKNRQMPDTNQNTTETPLEILKKRYAKGDITKEQFEQIKKDLQN